MTTLHRFPKLIYIPFVWGEEDKAVWRAMKHSGKRCLIYNISHLAPEYDTR